MQTLEYFKDYHPIKDNIMLMYSVLSNNFSYAQRCKLVQIDSLILFNFECITDYTKFDHLTLLKVFNTLTVRIDPIDNALNE